GGVRSARGPGGGRGGAGAAAMNPEAGSGGSWSPELSPPASSSASFSSRKKPSISSARAVSPASRGPNRRDSMVPRCSWPARIRFSRTVSWGKICSSWKVRLTPRRLRSDGRMPVTLRPSSCTSPALGASWPRMQLNRVDLPLPFGPMMPRISPARTSKETPATATMPPKCFSRPCTSRTTLMGEGAHSWTVARDGCPARLEQTIGEAEQPRRTEHHQENHEDRVLHQVVALDEAQPFGHETQPLGQQHRHHGAEERPEE